MSWPLVLIGVGTALSAGAQFLATRQQAAYGEAAGQAQKAAANTQIDMVRIRAMEEEANRLREARLLRHQNVAAWARSGQPLDFGGSFLTLMGENERTLAHDITSIGLTGKMREQMGVMQAWEGDVRERGYRAMGQWAWLAPVATLTRGAGTIAMNWPRWTTPQGAGNAVAA